MLKINIVASYLGRIWDAEEAPGHNKSLQSHVDCYPASGMSNSYHLDVLNCDRDSEGVIQTLKL